MAEAFDWKRVERQMREQAKADGIDLDALIGQASLHFTSSVLRPGPPLTEEQLNAIVADEISQPPEMGHIRVYGTKPAEGPTC